LYNIIYYEGFTKKEARANGKGKKKERRIKKEG
jgi:hypothetical protein